MAIFSKQVKKELIHALSDNDSAMFVVDGKLFSIEIEDSASSHNETTMDLAEEIENYPELKASLTRYLDQPDMKRYSPSELKELRNGQRR